MLTYYDRLWPASRSALHRFSTSAPELDPPDLIILSGLFRPPDESPVTCMIDRAAARWKIGDTDLVVDDFLTAATLYTCPAESFVRLSIIRPSRRGQALLTEYGQLARQVIYEPQPLLQSCEFGIFPEAEALWRSFVRERMLYHEELEQSIRSGQIEPPHGRMIQFSHQLKQSRAKFLVSPLFQCGWMPNVGTSQSEVQQE